MTKRTFASVTESPCACGFLERAAQDRRLPIRLDSKTNEYHVRSNGTHGTVIDMVIYHCPFCGGAAPESTRSRSFANIDDVESTRLQNLVRDIKSADDALKMLGRPDSDRQVKSEHGASRRVLIFSRLSDAADVHVNTSAGNSAEVTIAPKHLHAVRALPAKRRVSPEKRRVSKRKANR